MRIKWVWDPQFFGDGPGFVLFRDYSLKWSLFCFFQICKKYIVFLSGWSLFFCTCFVLRGWSLFWTLTFQKGPLKWKWLTIFEQLLNGSPKCSFRAPPAVSLLCLSWYGEDWSSLGIVSHVFNKGRKRLYKQHWWICFCYKSFCSQSKPWAHKFCDIGVFLQKDKCRFLLLPKSC